MAGLQKRKQKLKYMQKTFLGKLIAKVGDLFSGIFDKVEHAWHHVEPQVKDALIQASGITQIIKENLDAAPDFLFGAIEQKFPELTKEKIDDALNKIAEVFQIQVDADINITVKRIQEYLKGKVQDDSIGDHILSSVAQIFAIVFSPAGTPYVKIAMLIEFVYRTFIKKN